MFERIKSFLRTLVLKERSPEKLARSFALAWYISFAPWIGMQYPLVFLCSWLFSLNTAVLVTTSSVLSNPFTYVPICVFDYGIGYWLLHTCFGLDVAAMNPAWMDRFNVYLQKTLHMSDVSVWAFVIGGNIVGITLALVMYPVSKYIFSKVKKKKRT